ncbi:DegT/DnrJ/EryC1/StrS family aminotransferase [Aliiglaciecola litoralis]|uniref:DegT/DnrJ/EryC1/StrS aminotransferase family protein n=1 Tax=Aliiglaciecola litoralis TaxID=582857 RepID=A0ABP3WYA1_9ALTE
MAVSFFKPIADASQFPKPRVPATPKFKFSALKLAKCVQGEVNDTLFTRNGRGAIGIAGTALKNTDSNVILIPAYHCPALVEPFIWLGYEIRFYPVNEDLSVDISMLERALTDDVSHCVVVRYFGFGQNNNEVIEFLHARPVKVIEDCAHSLFRFTDHFENSVNSVPQVDASICSINKILPTIDGGALYLKAPYHAQLNHISWVEEFKACAFIAGIPQALDKIKTWLKGKPETKAASMAESVENEDAHLRYFQPVDLTSASYRHTKFIFCHSDLDTIKAKRRANFAYLTQHINNPAVGQPLFSQLTDDDVPYVIPFLLTDDKHFSTLRKQGIQILRWEEVAISDCSVSQEYRSLLIQIPCHQQLTQHQLDSLVSTFNQLRA